MEVGIDPLQTCDQPAGAIELFVRTASVLPRRPAVLVLNAAPDQDLCEGNKFRIIQHRSKGLVSMPNLAK